MGEYVPTSDGFPNDEDLPATFSANRVVGDIVQQGADQPYQRLVDSTTGAGLFTTNSDPAVVGVDPLTGLDAPTGTDVGFGAAVRRYVQTNVMNGDFAVPPPDPSEPVSEYNPLPYWTVSTPVDGSAVVRWAADSGAASGYSLLFEPVAATGGETSASQLVPVPMTAGRQYRALASVYDAISGGSSLLLLDATWLEIDATTAIGSTITVSAPTATAPVEIRGDLGLVPSTAAYLRLGVRLAAGWALEHPVREVRVAFLPVEATVGLRNITASSGAISTVETSVVSATIPPDSLTAGSVYTIKALATLTDSGGAARVCTFRVRIGPSSLSGAVIVSINPTTTGTASASGYMLEATVTVRSAGASGGAIGAIEMNGGTQPFAVGTRVDVAGNPVTIDTTVSNVIELTAVTANASTTTTFRQAYIQCVSAA